MAKKWIHRLITFPDGRTTHLGANGYLNPMEPCGHCGKPIRYYKGPYDVFPWFCSSECADGVAVKVRCAACGGAMRKPHAVGTHPDGRKLVVCRSCAVRTFKRIRKDLGYPLTYIEWYLTQVITALRTGNLKLARYTVDQGLIFLTGNVVLPKPAPVPKAPETPVDSLLQMRIRMKDVGEDGRYPEGHPWAGQHYRERFPDPQFPPPPPISPPTDV